MILNHFISKKLIIYIIYFLLMISIINDVNYKILKPSEILLNSLDYITKKAINSIQIK